MSKRFLIGLPSQRLLSAGMLLGALAFATIGCGEITKQKECSAVIDVINAGQSVMEKDAKLDDPKAVEEHAKELEDYGKKIGDVKITDVELKKQVESFHKNIDELAKFLRDLSKGTSDFATITKRASEIDTERGKLVDSINGYCSRK
jgi:uncharacterized protein YoxC